MDVLILMQGMVPVPGHPVTGNGLRAQALAEGLRGRGHRVRFLTRAIDRQAVDASALNGDVLVYDETAAVPAIVAASGAGAAVVCDWDLLESLAEPSSIPIVADLYGPRLVEAQFEHVDLDRESARFVDTLRRADCFLVASERQRWFALPWLMLAGFDCRSAPLHVVPISASPAAPPRARRKPAAEPVFVSGGVFWPWRASEEPLARLLAALDDAKHGHVDLFGGSYPLATEARVAYRNPLERLPGHPRLSFHGMVAYDELLRRYQHAQVAFDVMERNAERELSFSFRIVDYLASGLPVVTNDFTEVAAEIARAEAGWLVDLERPGDLERVVGEVLADPAECLRRGRNARKLFESHFTWDRTIEPLDRYLREPKRALRTASVLGTLVQVAGEAYRAREDRLREIERSRGAIARAEALDRELGELHRVEAEHSSQLNLARAELEARTRDLDALKDQAAGTRRELAARLAETDTVREAGARKHAELEEATAARDRIRREAEALRQRIDGLDEELRHRDKLLRAVEADRDRSQHEAEALRGDRDQTRARVEALALELRTASEAARDARATFERADDELRGARALAEHRALERDRAAETARAREDALARLEEERKRLATEAERLEAKALEAERRLEHGREQLALRDEELRKAKSAHAEAERDRDRAAETARTREDALARLEEERKRLATEAERLEAKALEAERRLEHGREQLALRDEELRKAKSAHAEAERDRDRAAETARDRGDALARLEDERKHLAAEGERLEARALEAERRLEHGREQLAQRDEELRKARSAHAEAERERDHHAQEAQALTRARDALEARVHQLEQRLDTRGAELEDLARQVASSRGEIERKLAELDRARQEADDLARERDLARNQLEARDEELRRAKDAIADTARERDRQFRDAQELRERFEGVKRESHEAVVAARADRETLLRELGEAREQAQEQLAKGRAEQQRLSHELASREHDLGWLRTEVEGKDRELLARHERLATLDADLEALRTTLGEIGAARERAEREIARILARPVVRLWLKLSGSPKEPSR